MGQFGPREHTGGIPGNATAVQTNHHRQREPRTAGFTLIEMLLALGVLLVLLASVYPPIDRLFHDHRLQQEAEEVRNQLASARLQAMRNGMSIQFRFEPQGRWFLSVPYEYDLETDDAESDEPTVSADLSFAAEMKEGFRFVSPDGAEFPTETVASHWLAGLDQSRDLEEIAWSLPILFRADGTTEDAEFAILDSRDQMVRFEIRGLTGAVRQHRVEPGGEL